MTRERAEVHRAAPSGAGIRDPLQLGVQPAQVAALRGNPVVGAEVAGVVLGRGVRLRWSPVDRELGPETAEQPADPGVIAGPHRRCRCGRGNSTCAAQPDLDIGGGGMERGPKQYRRRLLSVQQDAPDDIRCLRPKPRLDLCCELVGSSRPPHEAAPGCLAVEPESDGQCAHSLEALADPPHDNAARQTGEADGVHARAAPAGWRDGARPSPGSGSAERVAADLAAHGAARGVEPQEAGTAVGPAVLARCGDASSLASHRAGSPGDRGGDRS